MSTPVQCNYTSCTLLQDIRKVVQTLEQTAREILTVLQSVHQPSGFKESEHVMQHALFWLSNIYPSKRFFLFLKVVIFSLISSRQMCKGPRVVLHSEDTHCRAENKVSCGTVLQVGFPFRSLKGFSFVHIYVFGSHCFQHDDISMSNTCLICVTVSCVEFYFDLIRSWIVGLFLLKHFL